MYCQVQLRFAELGVKPYCPHKRLIILLPHRLAIQITAEDNAFHVVRQHIPRDAHVLKCVDHSYKEVFLLGIGKELNIALSAMVADHSEASYAVALSIVVQHIGKAPVHLVSLTGICGITATPVALRCSLLPLGRKKILMGGDVVLYNGQLTRQRLSVYAADEGMGCECVPLRYNYDKPEKPRISRDFGYLARFFILFQTEKSSREVVIS